MLTHAEPTIIALPRNTFEGTRREAAAREVLLVFGQKPSVRLLCFFDDQDCWVFKDESLGLGKANRGISRVVTKFADFIGWPLEVINCVYPTFSLGESKPAFDFVTYLHNSSCEDPVGMTMTFAHELQHFVQWATMPAVWNANERFKDVRSEWGAGFDSHEFPIEKEARIVAKRFAIRIHGREAVDRYIGENIAHPVNDLDRRNWRFIEGLDVSKPYDLELETALFDDELKDRPRPIQPLTSRSL